MSRFATLRRRISLIVFCVTFGYFSGIAQTPPNDSCQSVIDIPLGSGGFTIGTFQSDSINIDSASIQVGEFFHSSLISSGNDKKSIWYRFYIPARRGVNIELKQNANAIATKDVGFTTYLSNQCMPSSTDATNAKLTTLNQFGSSFHPCMDPGWYLVQVSAKARAMGKVYIEVTTNFPHQYPAVVNAEYDDQDSAHNFGDQVVGKLGSQTGYIDYELGCYTINDSSELFTDIGSNYLAYNQSAWFVFKANQDHDNTQFKWRHVSGCATNDTMAYRLFKGDCRGGGSLTLLDSSFSDWSTANTCYTNCSEIVRDYTCLFDSGEVYSVQLLYHKDNIKNMRFTVADQTSAFDSSNNKPTAGSARDVGIISGNNTLNVGFGCGSYIKDNTCGTANADPITVGSFTYNMSQWLDFELDEQSRLSMQFTYGSNNNYKRYQYLAFRLFKDTITSSCGDIDTSSILIAKSGNGTYFLDCLEPGKYSMQLLGTDSVRDYSSWPCSGSMHLGGDYRLFLNQSELPVANRFALTNTGEGDSINNLNDLPNSTTIAGQLDTVSCNDAIRPVEVCDTIHRKAMYRTFKIGDADNDGTADSGLLFMYSWQSGYRGYPYYDYNSWHRLYKGNSISLRASQSVSSYPDTLQGLSALHNCLAQSSSSASACIEPGEYTLVSFFDDDVIGYTERPRFQFYSANQKFDTYAKAEFLDSITGYGTSTGALDSFNCQTNPDTIDGITCGRRNAYHVFYLDSQMVTTIDIGYYAYYYGQCRYSLFTGDIRNGKSGLKLYQDGLNWSCTGYSRTTSDCKPLEPGWYTVVVSNDRDISYDSSNRVTSGDHRGLFTYPHRVVVTTRASSIVAPKFYRPSKAAFIDSLVNNNQALSYDSNYSSIAGTHLNLAKFQFPMEILECDLDTPLNHHPKATLCDTNTTDIVYYTFTLAKDAFVRIWGNVSGGTWDMKLFDFDVRKDSAKLGTATPAQDCNYSANHLEFCNLQSGTYSIVYYCKRTSGTRATVNPVMHIDSVAYSRFDNAFNAYDFGKIPGDGKFYDGKVGDVHPSDTVLPASHDMITCRTGAQREDPTGMSCYNHVSPYVYSKDTNAGLYLYDSAYYRYTDNTAYFPWNYPARRNVWYSFVVEGRGNVTIDLKGNVSSLLYPQINSMRFSIYESDEDGTLSFANLKSSGKVDSTYNDGLTFVDKDYYYCYYGSDLSATFQISSCEKSQARRYYVLVETSNYYNNNALPNVNHNVWLEIKYDSLYIPDTEFDFYSSANDINAKYGSSTVFAPETLYQGDSTYFAGSTLDSTDYTRTYPYASCSDPATTGTVWYKIDVDSTGYLFYNYVYSYLSGSTVLKNKGYDANRIRVYRSLVAGDSLAGLDYVPRISGSNKYYALMDNSYASYICVNPGTYYIQINRCNQHACSDYIYPQIVFDYHTGDFCETAVPLQLDTIAQTSSKLLVNCHTIGTDFGEDGSDMGCLFGPKDYKSSWFVVDYTDTTKVDLEFKLAEYTDATAGEIRYRTFYGNCKSLTSGPCNNNALTTFTLDCIRKGTYYVQVVTPADAKGEVELLAEAKENTDTTCNPVDIFQPNAAFYYNTGCPENVINFVNTSSRGDSIRYFWDFGYNGLTDTVINPTIVYPPSNQEQQFTVKLVVEQIAHSSKDSITIVIDVPFAPSVEVLNNDTNLCLGDSVTLTGTISHGDGVWSTGDSTSSITVKTTGMYFFEMQDKPQVLLNPSFEENVTTLGWTSNSGTWTRTGSYSPRDSTYAGFGSHTAASATGILEIYQDIDVSADSIEIDSGVAKTSFTGYIIGHNSYEDEGQVIVRYLDASNNLLGIYQSGLKNYGASWAYLEHSRTTPKNTRKIRVIVQTNKVNTTTKTSYAFFDHFALKMRSACEYKDSVYVQINPYPTIDLPSDTIICPSDSLLVIPTITYDNPYVVQDSMNKVLSGELKNAATHTASDGYVSLTSNTVNAENGQIEWEDSTLSIRDSFTVCFDYYASGKNYYALYFYMFARTTPTNEDFASGGYSIAFDKQNSNQIQTEWNNSRLNTTSANINLDNGAWRKVKIVYNNQRFEIYIDNKLYVTYTDAGSRTQAGFKFGVGARSYYYNEYRVRNFHVSKNNPELVVVTPVNERTYTYNWSDANRDSTRYISPVKSVRLRVVDKFGCVSNYDSISVNKHPTKDSLFTSIENICSLLDSFQLTKPDSLGYYFGHNGVDSSGLVLVDSTSFGSNSVYFSLLDTNGCLVLDTGYFIVDSIPVLIFNPVDTLCRNDTAIRITLNHTDGYFYGGSFIDSAGWFSPGLSSQSVNKVYYRTNSTDCQAIDSLEVFVDSLPNATIDAAGPFCENGGVQSLSTQNSGGVFGVTSYLDSIGNFDPGIAMPGSHVVVHSLTDGNGCAASDSIYITVDSIPGAGIIPAGPFCANASIQTITPSNAGGRFTSMAYIDTAGQFNPSIAGAGSHVIYYTITDGNGCSNTDSSTIVIDSLPDASFNTNPPYCENGAIDTLKASVNAGGKFYGGAYMDSAGGFDPFVAKKGSHPVFYTYTDGNGCTSVDSTVIRVDTITPITINTATPYCLGDTIQLATATPNSGGFFSGGTFIDSIGNIDPTVAGYGNHKVYFTQTNGLNCTTYASTVIFVDSLPDASINAVTPRCENGGVFTISTVSGGGKFTSTSYLDTAGRFDPSVSLAGSYTVFYTVINSNGCSSTDSMIVVIDSIPNAGINAAGPFCENAGIQNISTIHTGGRFSPTSYLDTIGRFDPSVAKAGSYVIYYSLSDGNGCSSSDSTKVVVDSIPSAAINGAGPFCENASIQTLTAINAGGRFSPTSYLDTAGQFDPSAAKSGSHKVYYSYTDGSGCSNTDSITLVVDTIPDASINAAGPFCENGGIQTITPLNAGGRFSPTSYLDTTGRFDPSLAKRGSHNIYYTFTDGNNCVAHDSATVVVDSIPDASISAAGPYCENGAVDTLKAAINVGGRFFGGAYIDTMGVFNPFDAKKGNHLVYYSFTDSNGCKGVDSVYIQVDSITPVTINTNTPYCANDTIDQITSTPNAGGFYSGGAFIDSSGNFDPSIAGAGFHNIFFTQINGLNCYTYASTVVQVDSIPDASINAVTPQCENAAIFTVTPVNSGGRFTPTAYLDTAGRFDPRIAKAGTHDAIYVLEDSKGCKGRDTITVIIDSIPNAAIAQAGPFCENAGIKTLAARYNAGGKFGPLPYMDSAGNFNPLIAAAGTHKIYYTFTDGKGCIGNDSSTVVVDTLPAATINPAGPFCQNAGVQVLNPVTAGGKFTATGYLDTSGSFDPMLAGVGVFKIYYTLDDGAGCTNTDSLNIVVDSIPDASINATLPQCENGGVFTITTLNSGGRFTPTAYLDTTGQFNPSIATSGSHKVYYTIVDDNGCFNTDSSVVVIDTIPDASINAATPHCENGGLFIVTAKNIGGRFTPTAYLDTAGQFNPAIAMRGIHKIFYSYVDGNGCSNTDSTLVVIDSIPDAGINPETPKCENGGVFTVTTVNNGGRFTPTTFIDTAGRFDPAIAMSGSQTIYYSFTDGKGCSNTDSITVVIDTIPDASILPAGPFCANAGIQNITPLNNAGGSFSSTSYLTTAGAFNPQVATVGSHKIFYTFTDGNGCSNTDSSSITVDSIPDASINVSIPQCENASVFTISAAINAGGRFTPTAYLDTAGRFDPRVAQAGIHKVYYSFIDGNGCANTDSTNITINAISDAGLPAIGPLCINAVPTQINPTTAGGSFSGGTYINSTGLFDPGLAIIGQNKVVYSITNAAGCISSDSIEVQVLAIPTNTILLNPHEGCEPLGVFVSSERAGGEDSVVWFVNGERITDKYNFFGTYDRGTYQVRFNVYGLNGCNIQLDTSFAVFPKPVADFTYAPTEIYISDPDVQFTDRSTANVVAWNWDFGDAQTSGDENPNHLYADAGEYLVKLFVTSDQGCLDTAEQTLIIKDEILLFIPNAISPNNDGINDVFRVVGLGYTHIDITIYNRWGEQIYTSDDFTEWDATYKGEKVQMGAYVYIMNIVDNRGRKYHEYGEIQVVR